jgi:hypothetical protein
VGGLGWRDILSFLSPAIPLSLLYKDNIMNLIRCFSNVIGHKEAQEIVTDLNQMKSNSSDDFYIEYSRDIDYTVDDTYTIIGNVTKKDWDNLDLESDFMEADLI